MFNFCIHNKGADKNVRYPGRSATLLVSYNKVGVKHLQTCGKDFCKFWSFAVFIKMDVIKTFQFSVKKLNGRKIHPYWKTFPSKKDTRSDCS